MLAVDLIDQPAQWSPSQTQKGSEDIQTGGVSDTPEEDVEAVSLLGILP